MWTKKKLRTYFGCMFAHLFSVLCSYNHLDRVIVCVCMGACGNEWMYLSNVSDRSRLSVCNNNARENTYGNIENGCTWMLSVGKTNSDKMVVAIIWYSWRLNGLRQKQPTAYSTYRFRANTSRIRQIQSHIEQIFS